jgi:hypothetical protein
LGNLIALAKKTNFTSNHSVKYQSDEKVQ